MQGRVPQWLIIPAVLLLWLVISHPPQPEQPSPPYPHAEIIDRAADEFGVEAELVAAVIENESAFNKQRVSAEGAVGLMQVLPSTAEEAAAEMNMDEYTPERLFEPEMNIRLGTWYLSNLMKEFTGDTVAALAAYNAGPARVESWQNLPRWKEKEGIDRIPLMETRSYVMLVLTEYDRLKVAAAGR